MKEQKKKRVCCVATVYAFLLYLIYHKYEEIKDTFFVFDPLFPEDIANNVDCCCQIKRGAASSWYKEILYYKKNIKEFLPRLDKNTEIFAQDHTSFAIIFLSSNQYTFIEDSPCICKEYYKSPDGLRCRNMRKTVKGIVGSVIFGPLYLRGMADNKQATSLLLTADDDSEFLKGKQRLFIPKLNEELWNSFTDDKKRYILDVFGFGQDIEEVSKGDSVLLLTDPLAESSSVNVKEQIRIYKEIMSHYDESKIIIKTHPRDHYFDYRHYFPQSRVIDKPFPSELFMLLNLPFKKVVTAFSSAVYPFIGKIPVDWYGMMNDELEKEVGCYTAPEGVNIIYQENINVKK